jgi:iron uptake system EfeUOB component EfeO/EfeM
MRSACIRTGTLGLLLLFAAGCAALSDPLGRLDALDMAQHQYTEAIRWGYLDRARAFIEPERRAEFEQLEPVFQAIRFTDFEIGEIEGDKNEAQVTVTYRGYAHTTQIEHTFREQQHWKRVEGLANQWRVRSDLSEQVLALLGPTR